MAKKINLTDGEAHYMGEGVVIVLQKDERGVAQNVVLTRDDLRLLLEAQE